MTKLTMTNFPCVYGTYYKIFSTTKCTSILKNIKVVVLRLIVAEVQNHVPWANNWHYFIFY